MTNSRIIYQTDEGGVAIIVPAPDCNLSIEQIALKDVPFGKPFKIIDAANLPNNRTQRNAWAVDEEDLTDGIGADYGIGSENIFIMPEAIE